LQPLATAQDAQAHNSCSVLAPDCARTICGQPLIGVGQKHTRKRANDLTVWISAGQNTALCHDAVLFASIEAALEPLQAVNTLQGDQIGVHSQRGI